MNRFAIIARLEEYWYNFYKQNPDEPMGDIPAAVEYYWTLSDEMLLQEYNTLIGV